MDFLGRKHELQTLNRAWREPESAFVPIYGRRRVGKSELIVHFMTGKRGLYFTGKRAPAADQLQEFMESAARALHRPGLAGGRPTRWRQAFELLDGLLPTDGKFIFALDEFQWIAESSPELPSLLQELWDRHWSKSGRIMLILCGSHIGFMEREILGSKSPLFGRRTAQILLRPFSFLDAAAFHPSYSLSDRARVYALCGGVAAYLAAFKERISVEQNIERTLLDPNGLLAREPDFLLREELRDLAPYHSILTSLAAGRKSPSELGKACGIDGRAIGYYLQNLVALGYVRHSQPLSGAKPGLRTGRYLLEDPLLRFWFHFIFPHQSQLRFAGPDQGLAEIIRPGLDAYYGRCFERLCREALPLLYRKEGVRSAFDIGEYWDEQVQIDVVGIRQDNWTDLGECKWKDVASLKDIASELEAKISLYPNPRNTSIGRRVFVKGVKSKTAALPPGFSLHTLEDLYDLSSW